jgi:hypothetical protein
VSLFLSVAFICRLLAILNTLGFGLTYLLRIPFMPYHGVALEREWDALPTAFQTLVLALMRAVAGHCAAQHSNPADTLSGEGGLGVLDATREYLGAGRGCAVCDATSGQKHPCQTVLCADYDRRCTGNDWLGTVFVWVIGGRLAAA